MIILPVKNHGEPYAVNPTKLIALGLNYRDHIAESLSVKVRGFTTDVPTEPLLFPKTPNVLIGPEEAIVIPEFLRGCGFKALRTDYEAELAVIIGKRCKAVSIQEAPACIHGYTCMNDVSQRNIQNGDRTGWFRGKSLDTFGPIGPQVVLAADLPNPQALSIRCRLNGTVVQDGNTSQMIFNIPEIVAFVSTNFTLEPGDIILTGTPSGVGPLAHGDVVEVEIEQIGVLKNTVIDETL